MPGKYNRTEDIRQKQRIKMKEKIKEYDFVDIDIKRKQSFSHNKTTPGRKKGCKGNEKKGWFVNCCVCNFEFWVIPSKKHRRVCSRKCLNLDPVYKHKLKNLDKSYMKSEKYKISTRDPNLSKYKRYAYEVRKLTEINYLNNISLINPNGVKRTLCGIKEGYHLDHILSIKKCYNSNKTVTEAADISNLQLISWEDNLSKRTFERIKCD